MKNLLLLMAAIVVSTLSAATTYNWQNAAGGDLAESSNYSPQGRPSTGDSSVFNLNAAYRLTASADLTDIGAVSFLNGDIELALGDRRILDSASSSNFMVDNQANTAVTMTSGVITNFYKCVVGNAANTDYSAVFHLKNPGTVFATGRDDLVVGVAGGHNVLKITDGARFLSGRTISIGTESYSVNIPKCTHNGILVSGAGSRLEMAPCSNSGTFVIGNKTSFNFLTLDDQATFVHWPSSYLKPLHVGNSNTASNNVVSILNQSTFAMGSAGIVVGAANGACGNALIVSNRSQIVCTGFNLAYAGLDCRSNRIEILDGSFVEHSGDAYIGGGSCNSLVVDASVMTNRNFDVRLGAYGSGCSSNNTLTVRNGGRLYTARAFVCGFDGQASYNTMTFTGAGTFAKALSSELIVSRPGNSNSACDKGGVSNVVRVADHARLEVNGATIGANYARLSRDNLLSVESDGVVDLCKGLFYIGRYGGPAHAVIAGGHVRNCNNAYCGYGASGSTLTLSGGGTLEAGHLYLGNAGITNVNVLVAGAGSLLTNYQYDVTWQKGASNVVMRIEDGAVADICRAVYLGGEGGSGNLLSVSNATFRVRGIKATYPSLQVAAGATLELQGAAVVEALGGTSRFVPSAGSTIRFVADRSALGTLFVPNIDAVTDVALEVDASRLRNGGTFEIVRATGKINASFYANVKLTPATARLIAVPKTSNPKDIEALRVKVPAKGIVLFVL